MMFARVRTPIFQKQKIVGIRKTSILHRKPCYDMVYVGSNCCAMISYALAITCLV